MSLTGIIEATTEEGDSVLLRMRNLGAWFTDQAIVMVGDRVKFVDRGISTVFVVTRVEHRLTKPLKSGLKPTTVIFMAPINEDHGQVIMLGYEEVRKLADVGFVNILQAPA